MVVYNGKQIVELHGHQGAVLTLRFNKQGTYCLSGGRDRSICLWNPHKHLLVKTYQGHNYDVRDVCAHEDNGQFASCGQDRNIFVWDVATGNIIRKFKGHNTTTNSIVYAADNQLLVSGGYDQCIKIWDCRARTFDAAQVIKEFRDSVSTVCVSERAEIFGASVDGTIRKFDVRNGGMCVDELGYAVSFMSLTHDHNCMLAAAMNSTLYLVDKGTGTILNQYKGHKHETFRLEAMLTPDDAHVYAASEDGKLCCWDLLEYKMVYSFVPHSQGCVTLSMAIHPNGDFMLTVGQNGVIRGWK